MNAHAERDPSLTVVHDDFRLLRDGPVYALAA
jgi:hypothetical protein